MISHTIVASLGLALASAPGPARPVPVEPAPTAEISLGAGWAAAQAEAALAQGATAPDPSPPAPTGPVEGEPTSGGDDPAGAQAPQARPRAPRPNVRPFARHTDLDDRIREARRARALHIGAALAVQGAMVIYGISRAVEAAKEAEILRDERPPSQWKPMHPR